MLRLIRRVEPLALLGCFFLSGLAALIYQTAWLRQFSLVFGTSELAVATVLAAYMSGLALGAGLAARFAGRITRPVLVYGLLEAGIALSALAVPLLLLLADWLYASALGGRADLPNAWTLGQPIFYLGVAFVVLATPTALMGATLPCLTRHFIRSDDEVGPRVAVLYATNTAGAVVGTLLTAFVLLPKLGLNGTVFTGVGINALIFVLVLPFARIPEESITRQTPAAAGSAVEAGHPGRRIVLSLMLVSGAATFFYEVLWTRILAHVLGGSVYAFATMLAAFLTGIAAGGALGGLLAKDASRARLAFVIAQIAIAGLAASVYAGMQGLLPGTRDSFSLATYAFAVMLPATFFIGCTYPIAVRVITPDERSAAK
ncbi:MAG: spermidine synthase, partial [Gammaproteobacteria bacterium]